MTLEMERGSGETNTGAARDAYLETTGELSRDPGVEAINYCPAARDALPRPDTDAAVGFLRLVAPEGPWVLTVIADDGRTATRTYRPGAEASLRDWLATQNGDARRNVYFMVAEPTCELEAVMD